MNHPVRTQCPHCKKTLTPLVDDLAWGERCERVTKPDSKEAA
jgi:hypothetical protein